MTIAYHISVRCDICGVQSPSMPTSMLQSERASAHRNLIAYVNGFGWVQVVRGSAVADNCPLCAARAQTGELVAESEKGIA